MTTERVTRTSMRPRQGGFSLVEALIAVLVLSFTLLCMARLHLDMRMRMQLARQRTEALGIAQSEMESLRALASIERVAAKRSYADIGVASDRVQQSGTGATSYEVSRRTSSIAGGLALSVTVSVQWRDRSGTQQQASLTSIVARSEPALEAAWMTRAIQR